MLRYLAFCLFLASCIPSGKDRKAESPHASDSLIARRDSSTIPPPPSTDELKARLFDFFDRHGDEPTFDTTDDTMYEHWRSPSAFVKGGHLFTTEQTHAVIYYADDTVGRMHVYLKGRKGWEEIFVDNTQWTSPGSMPEFEDWNGDGVKDIFIYLRNPTDTKYFGELWLMNKQGNTLHYIEDFESIHNPQPGKHAGDVYSIYYYHGENKYLYRFSGNKIKERQRIFIESDFEIPISPDSCHITYCIGSYRNSVTIATTKAKALQAIPSAYHKLFLAEEDTSRYW